MFPKNSFTKTIHKSLQTLRSFLFKKYKTLPKTLIFCTKTISNSQNFDQIISPECVEIPSADITKTNPENLNPEPQNKLEVTICDKRREEHSIREGNANKSMRLEQKMKVLEMINDGDVDHALDVEEALHYYSRLTCPVYADIVDKFFMDMYKDYYYPQVSISLSSVSQRLGSSRRFGSGRRVGSSRRLGPVL